jgi:hypothetical protein
MQQRDPQPEPEAEKGDSDQMSPNQPVICEEQQRMKPSEWATMLQDDSEEMRRRIALAESGEALCDNDRKIAQLKDIHNGEIGWLIGNGPSVRIEDLERLKNCVTFCCNRFYLAYDRTLFRPSYLGSCDRQMIRDFGAEMVDRHSGKVFFVSEERPIMEGDFIWFPMKSRTPLVFSENVYDFVMPGGGTLVTAIQIGYHMGITKFYLYGVDHNFTFKENDKAQDHYEKATGDGNHFIENYRSGKAWAPPVLWQVEGALLSSHVFLQARGGWIKNATRGGKLEVLERVDFDDVAPR